MLKKTPGFFDRFFDLNTITHHFIDIFSDINFITGARVVGYFLIGLLLTLLARWFVGKVSAKQFSAHHAMLFRRIVFYLGLALSLIVPFKESGIDITALLGAAGILTAAVAFAAQTTISNFLSGVFLIAEKPFVIGDTIQLSDVLGEVLSIDLLSVKIRTKDNTLVRVPNETLLKAQFKNVSRFPIRRCDIKMRVSFNEDLINIKKILLNVADKNPLSLSAPEPEFFFLEFGESAILLQLSTWVTAHSFNELFTTLQMEIQAAFQNNDIRLPETYLYSHALGDKT
jgi:small-conductance mechanosensitive channel